MDEFVETAFLPVVRRLLVKERQVSTVSSEQVRRPIFTDGIDHWRNYEPWLAPLKAALGDVLTSYPGVPRNFGAA